MANLITRMVSMEIVRKLYGDNVESNTWRLYGKISIEIVCSSDDF